MKKAFTFISIVFFTLFLQSCSGSSESDNNGTSAAQIYTSVAASLTAQTGTNSTSTSTPQKTETIAPTKDTLSIPTLAQIAITAVSDTLVCDNAAFIDDITIPDGTTVSPGETFIKTWRIQNTGSCNWNTSYILTFNTGDVMSGSSTAIPYIVNSGKQLDISVSMTAPTDTGTYVGYWILQNSGGASFGQTLYVQVVVAASTSTSTATPTSTSEATSTPTVTVEPATATPAPTETTVVASETAG